MAKIMRITREQLRRIIVSESRKLQETNDWVPPGGHECPDCDGDGYDEVTDRECATCAGEGWISDDVDTSLGGDKECPNCDGDGYDEVTDRECAVCGGEGVV